MNTSRCPAIQGVIFASIGIKMASNTVDRGAERTLRKAITPSLRRSIPTLTIHRSFVVVCSWTIHGLRLNPFVQSARVGVPVVAGIVYFHVLSAVLPNCSSVIRYFVRLLRRSSLNGAIK